MSEHGLIDVPEHPEETAIEFPPDTMEFETKVGPRVFKSMGYAFETKEEARPAMPYEKHLAYKRLLEFKGHHFVYYSPKRPDAYQNFVTKISSTSSRSETPSQPAVSTLPRSIITDLEFVKKQTEPSDLLWVLNFWVTIQGTSSLNFRGVLAPDMESALVRGRLVEFYYNSCFKSETWKLESVIELGHVDMSAEDSGIFLRPDSMIIEDAELLPDALSALSTLS